MEMEIFGNVMREATVLFFLCLRCWGEYLYRALKRGPPPCTNRIKWASAAVLGAWLGHDQRNWCPGAARLPLALPPAPSVDNFSHTLCNFGSQHGVGAWSIPWWSPVLRRPAAGSDFWLWQASLHRLPTALCAWSWLQGVVISLLLLWQPAAEAQGLPSTSVVMASPQCMKSSRKPASLSTGNPLCKAFLFHEACFLQLKLMRLSLSN